jgi:hypothetical protein
MNRLTQVATSNRSQTISLTKTVAYDATGNITPHSDLGAYSCDPGHVHTASLRCTTGQANLEPASSVGR